MKLIYYATYPMEQMMLVVEEFIDLMTNDPLPDHVQIHDLYASWGGDGIQSWTIYDVDDAKFKDGVVEITRRMARFSKVPGYTLTVTLVLPIEEALAVVGREMPA